MTEPTDAGPSLADQLFSLIRSFGYTTHGQTAEIVDAIVAKWGQPPAVEDELVACTYGDNGYACCEGGPCRAAVHKASITTPQPTQAQAGAVPTDWDVRGQLAASLHCWHRLTGNEATELVAFVKQVAAHGIKGGQHGAE